MKTLLVLLLCGFLLFGCIDDGGGQPPPPPPDENDTGVNGDGISVVVNPQQNTTIGENITQPPDVEPPDTEEIEYVEDESSLFTIYFIHVGDEDYGVQGDAILIKKGDLDILVDAGSAQTANRVIDFLKAREVDDLDVLMVTNADPHHYGGIPAIANEYDVEEFWWSGVDLYEDQDYADAVEIASEKAEVTVEVHAGYTRTLNGMTFEILNPPAERFGDVNNDGIVTRLSDRNFTALLMSGVQTGAHNRLLNEYEEKINVDVLQAPFYGLGSGTQNFGVFLVASLPDTVVISGSADDSAEAGGSREPFLRYLEQYEIPYNATYLGGTVRITSDGYEYDIAHLG